MRTLSSTAYLKKETHGGALFKYIHHVSKIYLSFFSSNPFLISRVFCFTPFFLYQFKNDVLVIHFQPINDLIITLPIHSFNNLFLFLKKKRFFNYFLIVMSIYVKNNKYFYMFYF